MRSIYADYQASTPIDPRVVERMTQYWGDSFGNPHSNDHAVGWHAAEAVREATVQIASFIGADPDEIVLTSGATEANNLALLGLARRAPASRRRILVSAIEHKCVLAAARVLADRERFFVETIPVDREGFVDLDFLEKQLDDSVLLVSIMAVNNEIGTIQDISAISRLLESHGAFFHCDAAQAPCAMEMSSLAAHADLISLSGHKMHGPQGIGALYIRRDIQRRVEPLIYGGGQQNGIRSGTVPVGLAVGMGIAAEIAGSQEWVNDRVCIAERRDNFVRLTSDGSAQATINGPVGTHRHPGNANLRFLGVNAQDLLGTLQPWLAASTGAACSSGTPEPSHVLRAIGLSEVEAEESVRFSFGRFTTKEEIAEAARLVKCALEKLAF